MLCRIKHAHLDICMAPKGRVLRQRSISKVYFLDLDSNVEYNMHVSRLSSYTAILFRNFIFNSFKSFVTFDGTDSIHLRPRYPQPRPLIRTVDKDQG